MGHLSNHRRFNLVTAKDYFFFPPHTAITKLLEQNRVCTPVFSQPLGGSHGFVLRGLPKTARWKES